MKVLWLTNLPSPYRVGFFNEMGKLCDLTVLFERKSSDERDESWDNYEFTNFNHVFLKGVKVGVSTALCPEVVKYLDKRFDRIIIHNFSTPTGILAINYLKLRRIGYFVESDGGLIKSESKVKKEFKKRLLNGAIKYFSTAKINDDYFVNYGIPEERIVRYPFTSIYDCDVLSAVPSHEEKKSIRSRLGMTEKVVVLAVGRIIPLKGYDVLIEASKSLSKDIGIYIVGGSAPQEYVNEIEQNNLFNIHFVDFQIKESLSLYYLAADLFVHPTRSDVWGLVINEAMAKGLPVVTTDKCVAGIEMVKDGINGYVVPVDDKEELAKAIRDTLFDIQQMSDGSLKTIKDYTIENMANIHFELLK